MARKSSKTAHVMNLLAGDEPETSKSEAAKENQAASLNTDSSETIKELTVLAHKASIQTQEGPLTPSPISIIDMSSSSPDPVSEMIRQQLETEETLTNEAINDESLDSEALAGEEINDELINDQTIADGALTDDGKNDEIIADKTITEETLSKEEAIQTETKAEDNLNMPGNSEAKENSSNMDHSEDDFNTLEANSEEIVESPVILTAAEVNVIETNFKDPKTNSAPEAKASDVKEQTSSPELEKSTFKYLNVMEHVVQNKVLEYAAKLDVCCCGHCIADITALTLTNLPPKYVVVEPPSASPLLNFYVNRYSQQVIVELTKACFTVKQNPHH